MGNRCYKYKKIARAIKLKSNTKYINEKRNKAEKTGSYLSISLHEGKREEDRWGGRQRRSWTVQYASDKGQRHVLFMIQAVAAAAAAAEAEAAAGPRLK